MFERNEVAYNNFNHYNEGMSAGGTKFMYWTGSGDTNAFTLLLRGNYVHHNRGQGLWCDGADQALWEGNISEYNRTRGLFYEVSRGCEMRCNISRFNSREHVYPWHNISISSSTNSNVHHNVVVAGQIEGGHGNGIIANCSCEQDRLGDLINLNVHHNDITFLNGDYFFKTGIRYNCIFPDDFKEKYNFQWDYNTYHTPAPDAETWCWGGRLWDEVSYHTWSEWQGHGFDTHGTIDTDVRADRQLDAQECSDCQQYIDYWRNNGTSVVTKPAASSHSHTVSQRRIEYDAASGTVRIGISGSDNSKFDIKVHNAVGRQIAAPVHVAWQTSKVLVNMSAVRSGVYFVVVKDGSSNCVERILVGY